jgi:spermidine/putrescine transport system substrate-binding protein
MRHPRERGAFSEPLSRREFIKRAGGTALAMSSLGAVLAACGSGTPPGSSGTSLPLARPDNPVTWPIFPDNKPIASGLQPEQNATLKLYNWDQYIYKKVLNDFQDKYKKYNVTVELSTFNNMDEALGKIQKGGLDFDIFFPTVDVLGKLVETKYLRPINQSYITNLGNVWTELRSPFYDVKSQYTVPYVTYTTGVAWRTDQVKENIAARPMPYDVFWDPQYKGKAEVLDDYRETMSMVLLRNHIYDVNTSDQKNLNMVDTQLGQMAKATNPLVNINDYVDLPEGKTWVNEAWSGDMVNAQYYGPKGFDTGVLRYWYLPTHAPVNNDTMALLRGGKAPVMAHLFLNYMLDFSNSMENFSWLGYQPPQTAINAGLLIKQQLIPPNLNTTVVNERIWKTGARELELNPSVDAAWHDVWSRFKAGA